MKREFLKSFNLEEEVIDKIMAQYGNDIEMLKNDNKARIEQIKKLEDELNKKKDQLSSFEAINKELEELKTKLAGLQEEKSKNEEKYKSELRSVRLKNAVEKELTKAGAKNHQIVMPLLADFLETAELDESGNVKDLSDKVKSLVENRETSFLFEHVPQVLRGQTPGTRAEVRPDTPKDFKNMSYEQICEVLKSNNKKN